MVVIRVKMLSPTCLLLLAVVSVCSADCPNRATGLTGNIDTDGNMKCEWSINVSNSHRISLVISTYTTDGNCNHNNLEIFNDRRNGPRVLQACSIGGVSGPFLTMISSSNNLFFRINVGGGSSADTTWCLVANYTAYIPSNPAEPTSHALPTTDTQVATTNTPTPTSLEDEGLSRSSKSTSGEMTTTSYTMAQPTNQQQNGLLQSTISLIAIVVLLLIIVILVVINVMNRKSYNKLANSNRSGSEQVSKSPNGFHKSTGVDHNNPSYMPTSETFDTTNNHEYAYADQCDSQRGDKASTGPVTYEAVEKDNGNMHDNEEGTKLKDAKLERNPYQLPTNMTSPGNTTESTYNEIDGNDNELTQQGFESNIVYEPCTDNDGLQEPVKLESNLVYEPFNENNTS